MKAMTCPQCGALIKKISLKDEFADCDYCKAKILLAENKDKIVEITEKKLTAWEQYRENRRKIDERTKQNNWDIEYSEETQPENPRIFGYIILAVIALIVIGAFIAIAGNMFSTPPQPNIKAQTPYKINVLPTISYPTSTPLPQINYVSNVRWEGADDMENFVQPQIDVSKLPTANISELKKTVFKNRAVQVKITIAESGEVTTAEAISGHPILKEAAVNSAKSSLFNSRSKPTTRILTYYFRLTDE